MPHSRGEIGTRRLDEQVVVISHQAVGVAKPAVPRDDLFEQREEALIVTARPKNELASVAARRYVVERVFELKPERSGHLGQPEALRPGRASPLPFCLLHVRMLQRKT